MQDGVPDVPALIRFLVGRQLAYVDPPEGEDDEELEDPDTANCVEQGLGGLGGMCEHVGFNGRWNKRADTCYCWWVGGTLKVCPPPSFSTFLRYPLFSSSLLPLPTHHLMPPQNQHNANEQLLGHPSLIDAAPSRAFLLDKTQHIVGGFAKHPGGTPDPYHSYLGLAALATMGDHELGGFDAGLCVPEGVVGRIEKGRAVLMRGAQGSARG